MPAIDRFSSNVTSPSGPSGDFFAITPHNTNELPYLTRGLFIGDGGHIALVNVSNGQTITFRNVASGSILPVRTARVLATGTTASGLVGLI